MNHTPLIISSKDNAWYHTLMGKVIDALDYYDELAEQQETTQFAKEDIMYALHSLELHVKESRIRV